MWIHRALGPIAVGLALMTGCEPSGLAIRSTGAKPPPDGALDPRARELLENLSGKLSKKIALSQIEFDELKHLYETSPHIVPAAELFAVALEANGDWYGVGRVFARLSRDLGDVQRAARAFVRSGHYQEAEKAISFFLQHSPETWEAKSLWGLVLVQQGQIPAGLHELTASEPFLSSQDLISNLEHQLMAFWMLSQPQRASEVADRLLALDPTNHAAHCARLKLVAADPQQTAKESVYENVSQMMRNQSRDKEFRQLKLDNLLKTLSEFEQLKNYQECSRVVKMIMDEFPEHQPVEMQRKLIRYVQDPQK